MRAPAMCGAYYLRQSTALQAFFGLDAESDLNDFLQFQRPIANPRRLGDINSAGPPRVFRPTDPIPIIVQNQQGELALRPARWWLLMRQDARGDWQPLSEFASFNSRIDKVISTDRTAHNQRPRAFRVLLPATGFIEWTTRAGQPAEIPHAFVRQDGQPLLLGGMAKAFPRPDGSYQLAASMVTLPGHPKTQHIHAKSIPLMLEDEAIPPWLDRTKPHQDFAHYQTPSIGTTLTIQPLRSLQDLVPTGEAETVAPD